MSTENNEVYIGTIKFYSETRRFGFIETSKGAEEWFFHRKNIVDQTLIGKGDKVKFTPSSFHGRSCAILVTKIPE